MDKTVSIIIPCKNEEKYIGKCLDSIVASNFDKKLLSVFVCDGMSTDNTCSIVSTYSEIHSFIQLLNNEKHTTPFALNLGIQASNNDYFIILGAHAEIDKNFITNSLNTFNINSEIGCTGGVIENVPENKTAEIIGLAMSSGFGVGNAHFRTGNNDGYVDTVAFGAYKREVIADIGLFDEDLARNQDDEYNFRLTKAGFKIYLSKSIRSKYYVRASFTKLFKQYYQYGYWKVYVNAKHKTVTTTRQLVPAIFVLFLTSAPIAFLFKPYSFCYILGLFTYAFANLSYAFKQSKKPLSTLQIGYTFLILHLSYGLGYLEGIFNFLILGRKPKTSSSNLTR